MRRPEAAAASPDEVAANKAAVAAYMAVDGEQPGEQPDEQPGEKKRKRVDTYYDNESDLVTLSEKDDRTVMVRLLHPRTGEFDVFELFSKAGTVIDVRLITDERSGKCVGVGYVEMGHVREVEACLKLNGTTLCGNPIVVQHSLAIKNRLSSQGASQSDIRAAGHILSSASASGTGLASAAGGALGLPESGGVKLYVGGLDYSFTENQIREIFVSFGELDHVSLQHDAGTGMSRGFAFVNFKNADEGRRCVEQMDGFSLAGRTIKVSVATNQDSSAKALQSLPLLNPAAAAAAGFSGSLQLGAHHGGGMGGAAMAAMAAVHSDNLVSSLDGLDESGSGKGEKLGASQRAALVMRLAQNAGMDVPDATRKAAAQSYAFGAGADPGGAGSRCVLLKNMFDRLDDEVVANPNFFTELADDVRGECTKLGTVLFCGADKWSNGFVYVKMLSAQDAARVIEVMNGRFFAKNKIIAATTPEDVLDKKFKLHNPALVARR